MAADSPIVEVFVQRLDAEPAAMASLESLLSVDERRRAERLRSPRESRRFVMARGFLRTVLARRLGVAPAELRLEYGPFGKPRLAEAHAAEWEFNLSHSAELAALAIARQRPVGVDVEQIRPLTDARRIAARYLPAAEAGRLDRLPEEQRPREFLAAWTRFESRLKARGAALFAAAAGAHDIAAGWTTVMLELPAPYVGAVTVRGDECRLSYEASSERMSFPAADSVVSGTNSISLGR